jgi:tetratricopeptide (TPR) repeat protein
MLNSEKSIQESINKLDYLYKRGSLKEAYSEARFLSKKYPNIALVHNFFGLINLALSDWEEAVVCFNRAIKLQSNYPEAYNNLGLALNNLGKLEEALINFIKALELKPNYERPHNNIIRILTFFNPKNNKSNPYVLANTLLQGIDYDYESTEIIKDQDVKNFFKKCNNILVNNIKILNSVETQIYRRNTIDLNCERHFVVFNTFNTIPEYCFGCYKIQVEPRDVMELFKLYFIFNKLKLKSNNETKCTTEIRPHVKGTYKGYIFCFSLEEAYEIREKLTPILNKKIRKNIPIKIRRGCSEFGISHPEYKKIDQKRENFMKYQNEWKVKENFIDEKLMKKDKSVKRIKNKSLSGVTASDIIIMRNWLAYAKKIGDPSYIKIMKEVLVPKNIENKLSNQLLKRKEDFLSNTNQK